MSDPPEVPDGPAPRDPAGAPAAADAEYASKPREPSPLRHGLVICGVLSLILGPAGCYNGLDTSIAVSTNGDSAGSATTANAAILLGVFASLVLPIVMTVVAACQRDRTAAGWSAALLAWPLLVTGGILVYA